MGSERDSQSPTLVDESTLTSRYQTTVPAAVRKALGLQKHDKLQYVVRGQEVLLRRAEQDDERDPALGAFLSFIAQDIERRPEGIRPLTAKAAEDIGALVEGVEVDIDAPLADDDG